MAGETYMKTTLLCLCRWILITICFLLQIKWGKSSTIPPNVTIALGRYGRHSMIIKDGYRYMVTDRYTWDTLVEVKKYTYYQHLTHEDWERYPYNGHFPSLWNHEPNEYILSHGNSSFILSTEKFITVLNPSLTYYNDSLIVAYRKTEQIMRIVRLTKSVGFNLTFDLKQDLSALSIFDINNSSLPNIEMYGEDPRLMTMQDDEYLPLDAKTSLKDNKLYVAFCRRFPKKYPELQMTYIELQLSDIGLVFDDVIDIKHHINVDNTTKLIDEKNWSPFSYNHSLLFIESYFPLFRVVTVDVPKNYWIGQATTVSASRVVRAHGIKDDFRHSEFIEKLWPFGEVRGGTPALLLNNGEYLSFFHSSTCIEPEKYHTVLKTYVMGAFTFTAEPPFRITRISRAPIVDHNFYSGPWTNLPQSFYHIDYVVFPLTYTFSKDMKEIYLVFGKQDSEGWYMRLNTSDLLSDKNMRRVQSQQVVHNMIP